MLKCRSCEWSSWLSFSWVSLYFYDIKDANKMKKEVEGKDVILNYDVKEMGDRINFA